jgi:hypothetical protein
MTGDPVVPNAQLPDLKAVLAGVLSDAPDDRTTVCVIVTNGVLWGSYWKRKSIPGLGESDALLTPDDLSQIRALSFVREIRIHTLAVSTPPLPLEADRENHLVFEALKARLIGEAVPEGRNPGASVVDRGAVFETYIRQMFDLLRSISESTGAGRRIWLTGTGAKNLHSSIKDILRPVIGKFQRRDFRVLEAPSRETCRTSGREQILESARYRGGDKIILAIALDESGSTQTDTAAGQITAAAEHLVEEIRPDDDCIMIYTFSAGVPATSLECFANPDQLKELIQSRVRFGGATDIYGAALSVAKDLTGFETAVLGEEDLMRDEQELRKVIVLVTDGYQTVDNTSSRQAGHYLRRHDVMLFQVFIQGGLGGGMPTRGWASSVGGLDLPPDGVEFTPEEVHTNIAPLIESVYWGARQSYRLTYTSNGREKSRREVCVEVRGREDLFVSRERGESYLTDRSALTYVLAAARDASSDLPKRHRAITVLSDIGTEFELRDLRKLAAGPDEPLRAPAFLAYLKVAHRVGHAARKIEKSFEDLDPATRRSIVAVLPPAGWGQLERPLSGVEALLVNELTRPDNRARPQLRLEALLALGRLAQPLSTGAIEVLEALRDDPDPGVKVAAAALLRQTGRTGPGIGS